MRKDSGTAYLLWALGLCGVCGLQRFYLGQPVPGVLYLLTFGVCGVGQLIDLFLIPGEVRNANLSASGNNNQQNIVVHVGNNTSEFATEKVESRLKPNTLKPLTLTERAKGCRRAGVVRYTSSTDSWGRFNAGIESS